MTQAEAAGAPGDNTDSSARNKIVAGTALLAALAGAGITAALDYPWHASHARRDRLAMVPAPKSAPATIADARGRPAPAAAVPQPRKEDARAARPAPRSTRPGAAPGAQAARPAAPPQTLDARYEKAVQTQCSPGWQGLICREAIRWRLCRGHWHEANVRGAARCRTESHADPLPSLG